MSVNRSRMPLGKHPARHDPRALQFADYRSTKAPSQVLPPAPPDKTWAAPLTNLGVMLNDTTGDCTCAAAGHLIQLWTANLGQQLVVPDTVELPVTFQRRRQDSPDSVQVCSSKGTTADGTLTECNSTNPLGGPSLGSSFSADIALGIVDLSSNTLLK